MHKLDADNLTVVLKLLLYHRQSHAIPKWFTFILNSNSENISKDIKLFFFCSNVLLETVCTEHAVRACYF